MGKPGKLSTLFYSYKRTKHVLMPRGFIPRFHSIYAFSQSFSLNTLSIEYVAVDINPISCDLCEEKVIFIQAW